MAGALSDGFEMRVATLVEFVVGIAHSFGLAATQHHLHVHRLETVVLISVDHACGARNALPGTATMTQLYD